MTPVVGSLIANRFRLVRELGRGSMGSVWLADHLMLDLRCAVKFMTGDAARDPNYLARFELEARAVAQLHSPNVVRVHDYDVFEGTPYIAMEYLQGEDLAARLKRVGRLDSPSTYELIAQIARGLGKAHAAGIVHRDLKPENIFLAQEDEGEVAKLLDFGIAKLTGYAMTEGFDCATQAGFLLGTPAYMSPEQARGLPDIDHRADLWSLAVIAFECLTGRLPFTSGSLGDLFAQIMFDRIPIPTEVASELPPDFDWWWARAASRHVEGRFASAKDLAEGLGRALGVVRAGVPDVMATLKAAERAPVRVSLSRFRAPRVIPSRVVASWAAAHSRMRRPRVWISALVAVAVIVAIFVLNLRTEARGATVDPEPSAAAIRGGRRAGSLPEPPPVASPGLDARGDAQAAAAPRAGEEPQGPVGAARVAGAAGAAGAPGESTRGPGAVGATGPVGVGASEASPDSSPQPPTKVRAHHASEHSARRPASKPPASASGADEPDFGI